MRPQCYILLFFDLLLLASCASTKKMNSVNTVIRDTVYVQVASMSNTATETTKERTQKDTAVGFPAQVIIDNVPPEQTQQQLVNGACKPKPFHKSKKVNGVTAWVDMSQYGALTYGANTDSLTLVIANVTHEKEVYKILADSMKLSKVFAKHSSEVQEKTLIEKTKSFFSWAWPWLLGVAILAIIWLLWRRSRINRLFK